MIQLLCTQDKHCQTQDRSLSRAARGKSCSGNCRSKTCLLFLFCPSPSCFGHKLCRLKVLPFGSSCIHAKRQKAKCPYQLSPEAMCKASATFTISAEEPATENFLRQKFPGPGMHMNSISNTWRDSVLPSCSVQSLLTPPTGRAKEAAPDTEQQNRAGFERCQRTVTP